VFHRELTASDLSDAVLLDLLRMEDPLGVLSIFVEMPVDGADRRAEIEIKDKLTQLEDRAGGNGSLLRAEALRSTLTLVMPAVERLLDPGASCCARCPTRRSWRVGGRGRAERGLCRGRAYHAWFPTASGGGIIGAFLAALLGAIASGYALPTPGIPLDNPPGWTEALWPVPGSLLALTASYLYGARLERLAGEDDR
jgi:hypothetical protein